MKTKNLIILIIAFVIVVIAQLLVPAKMIFDREDILRSGNEYKFKCAPIDPSDPFRGNYIALNFKENVYKFPVMPDNSKNNDWTGNEKIFVNIEKDKDGFVKINSVSKTRPSESNTNNSDNTDYVKAKVSYYSTYGADSVIHKLFINYPFDRFYMEESKAKDADILFSKAFSDTNQVAYALVNIKDGEAIVKDVMIDGVSLKDIVTARNKDK